MSNGRPDLCTLSQAVPPESQPLVRLFCCWVEQGRGRVRMTPALVEWRRMMYGYNHKVRRRV